MKRMKLTSQKDISVQFPEHRVRSWLEEIRSQPELVWHRMIYYRWRENILEDHEPVVKWMQAACSHACFMRNRATHDLGTGYQLWFNHVDDVMLATLALQDPPLQIRQFTTEQMCEDMIEHFCFSQGIE